MITDNRFNTSFWLFAMMLAKGLVTVALSYLGARLAIRHERATQLR